MRIKPLGKFIIMLLVAGLCTGVARFTHKPAAKGPVSIEFLITAAKKDWAVEQIDRFNKDNQGQIVVTTRPLPSREALHAILKGEAKPVLWSPGSPIWPTRLGEAFPHPDAPPLVDMSDPTGYRVFLRTPLVFVTTKSKATFLRPLLSGPQAWQNLHDLSTGKIKVPWGKFRYSHADPLTSSSGMMTLGLQMVEYQRRHPELTLEALHTDAGFLKYLQESEQSLIYDAAAQKGTTALAKAFFAEPGSYEVITAYESAVLDALPHNDQLAVIYPTPTFYSEHAVTLLNAPWVNAEQRAAAQKFLRYLADGDSMKSGVAYHFRPAPSSSSSLDPELRGRAANGFQGSVLTVEMPSYAALNDAAYQWRVQVAKMPPTQE